MNAEEQILRDKPFNKILTISNLESLKGRAAISGDTYKVTDIKGNFFKLRKCKDVSLAKELERNVNLLKSAFPRFYGREKEYLLFDWINGPAITKEFTENMCY